MNRLAGSCFWATSNSINGPPPPTHNTRTGTSVSTHPDLLAPTYRAGCRFDSAMTLLPFATRAKDRRWPVLYELRRYDVMPGRMPRLLDRFGSFTTKKWAERGFRLQ